MGTDSCPENWERFQVVSIHELRVLEPLPEGLEDLPLYPDGDGFYSITGPLSLTNCSPCPTLSPVVHQSPIQPLNNYILSSVGQPPPRCPPHRDHCDNSPVCPDRSQRGRPKRESYTCNVPNCTWKSPFRTSQALKRHHEVKHQNKRWDCPIPGCEKVGAKGIKREDNIPAHVWNKHGFQWPRRPRHNKGMEDAIITEDHSC